MRTAIVLLVLALCGCSTGELSVRCKGKGTIMAQGYAVVADCGDGFEYERQLVK